MKIVKCIIKPVAFITLFLILLSAVSVPLFVSSANNEYQWMAGIYKEREDSLDAVYIGSSNCYAFWNPVIAWEKYGISVFPYVCSSQPLIAAEYLVREARKTQPDALYIINTNTVSILGDGESEAGVTNDEFNSIVMHRLLDYMPLSLNKLKLTDYLCDVAGLSFAERLEYYFPIIRYHDKWDSLTEENFDYDINTVKGADTLYWYLGYIHDVTEQYYDTDECLPISDVLTDSLNSLLDYCEEEDVRVLFVTVPRAEKNEGEPERINTVNKLIEDRGFTVLDLVGKKDEIGLDTTTDYYNINHTNLHGSIKFTYYLSDYLIENYGFEDKRGFEDYADWDAAVDEYNEIIKNRHLPVEHYPEYRNYNIPAPWVSSITANGDSAIDVEWTAAWGAVGYEIYRKVDDIEWVYIADSSETKFTDCDAAEPGKYVYTIVPYSITDGEKYYGKFNYWGRALEK